MTKRLGENAEFYRRAREQEQALREQMRTAKARKANTPIEDSGPVDLLPHLLPPEALGKLDAEQIE